MQAAGERRKELWSQLSSQSEQTGAASKVYDELVRLDSCLHALFFHFYVFFMMCYVFSHVFLVLFGGVKSFVSLAI